MGSERARIRGLFFTGTDTGVGKTLVTSAVARLLRHQGKQVSVSKPVATGAVVHDGRLVSSDSLALAKAAGVKDDLHEVTPWLFAEPVAPSVAARRQGSRLQITEIEEQVRRRARPNGILLVEGVGGLLCPLGERQTIADLARALALPLVVVTRRSLGTLNHTLLTLEAARTRGLAVAGVVVSETTRPCSLAEETNVEELKRQMEVPLLAVLPFQENPDRIECSTLAEVDWWGLSNADD